MARHRDDFVFFLVGDTALTADEMAEELHSRMVGDKTLSGSEQDVVDTLRDIGHPIIMWDLEAVMVEQGKRSLTTTSELRAILAGLVRRGIITNKRGAGGGYRTP